MKKAPIRVRRPALLSISLLLLVFISCSPQPDVLGMVRHGDHSSVHARKYPQFSHVLEVPSEHDAEIARQRERIENVPDLMNELASRLYPEEKDDPRQVRFKYRGASVNEDAGELVIWYMGSVRSPGQNAGYRAQWVFDLEKEYLKSVYLSVVPLE